MGGGGVQGAVITKATARGGPARNPRLLLAGRQVAGGGTERTAWQRLVPERIDVGRQRVEIERLIEMDAMLGTLDFVSRSDWLTILPGIMMAIDDPAGRFKVCPLSDPPLDLDLVLIEPSRRPLSQAAQLFLAMLDREATRLNARWAAPVKKAAKVGKR